MNLDAPHPGCFSQERKKSLSVMIIMKDRLICTTPVHDMVPRSGIFAFSDPFSFPWRRQFTDAEAKALLSDWPVERPQEWLVRVNRPETDHKIVVLRRSVNHGPPLGSDAWGVRAAEGLG